MNNYFSALAPVRLIALVISLLIISGCTTMPSTSSPPEPATFDRWLAHQSTVASLTHWQIDGRLFIKTSKDGFSSRFNWFQENNNYQINFSAPMNQGSYTLVGSAEKVTIRLPDNQHQSADDPETLMKKTLGFKLPISGLSYWLRGIPNPDDPDRTIILDLNERLHKLKQAGWDIEITRYINNKGLHLPRKLTMENRHLKIKLALKNWDIPE